MSVIEAAVEVVPKYGTTTRYLVNMKAKELIEHLQCLNPDAEVSITIAGYMSRATEAFDDELQPSRAPDLDGKLILRAGDITASDDAIAIEVCYCVVFDVGRALSIWGDVSRM